MCRRGPDLLTGNDPFVAIEFCLCAQRSKIGTSIRFAEQLTPHLFAAKNRRKKLLLLLFGAVHDDRRTNHADGLSKHPNSEVVLVLLFEEDALLQTGETTTAKLHRPGETGPAVLCLRPLPITTRLHMGMLIVAQRAHRVARRACGLHG
ncbi:unannotated protein [freshwater metagenome]|uniref:Unannotated protein n=1 Tax=freshwater metagenome TaxID=449393 RepID=A0A6J6QSF3_9ZZZZ